MKDVRIENNTEIQRFEWSVEGHLAILEYRWGDKQTLVLTHTEVPESLEGRGIGSKLVEGVFDYAEQHNLKVVPRCGFVIDFLERHPEWNRLVKKAE
ncbi:GNAT family N-acetyltransferase [Tellurirhabdus bombi]|uniref:GNAT family N-acetyltransferase n=1 Tax=Tellurirhabdus bombi TaxID=2907205 RepID=UPI001F23973C|nr:GNAT family N-acetyltransferase [Tellurirhabdus bombi]